MRSIDRRLLGILIAGLAPVAIAKGDLTVVGDHGGQPATPYYAPIAGAGVDKQHAYKARAEARGRGPVRETDMLPVHSERLSPGAVQTRALSLSAGMTPFFMLGADVLSLRWLKQRGARLRALHAVGLVVDVESPAQLRALRRAGQGLVLRPVAGDDIAARLDLAHYPLLITAKAIQQ